MWVLLTLLKILEICQFPSLLAKLHSISAPLLSFSWLILAQGSAYKTCRPLFIEICLERLLWKIRTLFYMSGEEVLLDLVRLDALFFQQPWLKEQERVFCFISPWDRRSCWSTRRKHREGSLWPWLGASGSRRCAERLRQSLAVGVLEFSSVCSSLQLP